MYGALGVMRLSYAQLVSLPRLVSFLVTIILSGDSLTLQIIIL